MFGLIEKLRNKSETYRHVVALSTSLVVTLMLLGVWITVTFPNAITGKPVVAEKSRKTEVGPLDLFRQNTAQVFDSIKFQWNSVVKSLKETEYQSNNQIQIVSPETGEVVLEQNRAQ